MTKEITFKGLLYQIAKTQDDLEQAYRLVYQEYICRRYIPKGYKSDLRLSLYNALPNTTTFVVKQEKKVIATVTLIPDSQLGLPMEKIYSKEIKALRNNNRRLGEVSQLAISSDLFPSNLFSLFNFNKLIFVFRLFKLVLDYALYVEKLDNLCIAINPKQQYLYKFLSFEELGGLKYYGSVNKAPAIAKQVDLSNIGLKTSQRKGLYKIFFSEKTPISKFKSKYFLKSYDLNYFFKEKSDILEKASSKEKAIIAGYYPGYLI